jgi:hypothetical protein
MFLHPEFLLGAMHEDMFNSPRVTRAGMFDDLSNHEQWPDLMHS